MFRDSLLYCIYTGDITFNRVDKGKRLMKFLAPLISLETLFNGEAQILLTA